MNNLHSQILQYYSSDHKFTRDWEKSGGAIPDTVSCLFEFSWKSYSGNHPLVKVLNKEIAILACRSFYESCDLDSLTENFLDSQAEYFHHLWNDAVTIDSLYRSFYQSISITEGKNEKFLVLECNTETYGGGAHGIMYIEYLLFRRSDASRIQRWQQLFNDSSAILTLGESAFRREKEIPDTTATNDYWYFPNGFYLPQNFYLDEEGITFVYNVYEIASYADGSSFVTIPYSDIDKFAVENLH